MYITNAYNGQTMYQEDINLMFQELSERTSFLDSVTPVIYYGFNVTSNSGLNVTISQGEGRCNDVSISYVSQGNKLQVRVNASANTLSIPANVKNGYIVVNSNINSTSPSQSSYVSNDTISFTQSLASFLPSGTLIGQLPLYEVNSTSSSVTLTPLRLNVLNSLQGVFAESLSVSSNYLNPTASVNINSGDGNSTIPLSIQQSSSGVSNDAFIGYIDGGIAINTTSNINRPYLYGNGASTTIPNNADCLALWKDFTSGNTNANFANVISSGISVANNITAGSVNSTGQLTSGSIVSYGNTSTGSFNCGGLLTSNTIYTLGAIGCGGELNVGGYANPASLTVYSEYGATALNLASTTNSVGLHLYSGGGLRSGSAIRGWDGTGEGLGLVFTGAGNTSQILYEKDDSEIASITSVYDIVNYHNITASFVQTDGNGNDWNIFINGYRADSNSTNVVLNISGYLTLFGLYTSGEFYELIDISSYISNASGLYGTISVGQAGGNLAAVPSFSGFCYVDGGNTLAVKGYLQVSVSPSPVIIAFNLSCYATYLK
jgi:hypothetical protein